MGRKRWVVSNADIPLSSQISERFGISPLTSLILTSRGICEDEDIGEFLSDEPDFQDPLCIADMMKAKEAIESAIDKKLKIAVYGDYDADGVTSTAMLTRYLKSRGADVLWYVPERSEGYGLNNEAIHKLSVLGVKLIVTVDNGIAAVSEAQYIKSLGMSLVITDHHEMQEKIPEALAAVNPHRADCPSVFKEYAGVGVAFKLICAMEDAYGDKVIKLIEEYGEYLAIGTIADVVALRGENRLLLKYGLKAIGKTQKPDIIALKEASGFKKDAPMTSRQVAFALSPRINASGRVGFASEAVKLLLTTDEERATDCAASLNLYNYERKRLEEEVFKSADSIIKQNNMHLKDRIIVVSSEGWNEGVLGIVSAKITEKYGKPSIVLNEGEDKAHGSCRSIEGFKIYDALFSVRHLITQFGGHALAAGLTLPKNGVDEFRKEINEYAKKQFDIMPFPLLRIDCKLNPKGINRDFLSALGTIEPCGAGNPGVLFGLFRMRISEIRPISDGKYVRLTLTKNGSSISAVCFSMSVQDFPFETGDIIDAAVELSESTYAGGGVSVRIADMRISGNYEEELLLSMRIYDKVCGGETLSESEIKNALPERETFASLYRYLKNANGVRTSGEMLYHRMQRAFSYAGIMVCLDAMEELKLISLKKDGEIIEARLNETAEKCDLSSSAILTKIKKGNVRAGNER